LTRRAPYASLEPELLDVANLKPGTRIIIVFDRNPHPRGPVPMVEEVCGVMPLNEQMLTITHGGIAKDDLPPPSPGIRISSSLGPDEVAPDFPGLLMVSAKPCFNIRFMFRRKTFRLRLPSRTLVLGERTLVMGVLNVTPDSFSDGGLFLDADAAVARALEMELAGADLIDVGGESTRPGAESISASEEMRRVLPVLEKLRGRLKIPVSIDTSKAEVAEAAAYQGAEIINDVTALRSDPRLAEVAARRKVPLILMHMRGNPRTMQKKPFARNVLRDVSTNLRRAVGVARRAGVPKSQIVLDPGIGFGKSAAQNYELLQKLPQLARLGHALLVGTSRKSFLAKAPGGAPDADRIWGTAATVAASILGGAHIVRVHDVAEMVEVARVTDAVVRPQSVSAHAAQSK
jgi:dihydropteroate synthase